MIWKNKSYHNIYSKRNQKISGSFFLKRIEFFFSKILKEGVFDYLSSLTQADLERTKKYSDIEWSDALNEEAKRMPGFADTLLRKTQIESEEKGYDKATLEHVRNMQKEGFSPEMIAKIVQKSVATVKSMML